jgi:DNA processing protein
MSKGDGTVASFAPDERGARRMPVPKIPTPPVMTYSAEELLGPLNEVERRNAPGLLDVVGLSELLHTRMRVSIVGSRKASDEGLRRSTRLARILAQKEITVVSGLAEGIDTAAHTGAIQAGGATVAVLGTPVNEVFPAANLALQKLICEKHCATSQFPIGSRVWPENFVKRNRTMALISHASVIVEAGDSSGSLSQGWEALRLGRSLFFMKSVLDRSGLKWPEKMQHYGAVILAEPEELLDLLPYAAMGATAAASF